MCRPPLACFQGTREFDLPFSEGLLGNLRGFCCSRDDARIRGGCLRSTGRAATVAGTTCCTHKGFGKKSWSSWIGGTIPDKIRSSFAGVLSCAHAAVSSFAFTRYERQRLGAGTLPHPGLHVFEGKHVSYCVDRLHSVRMKAPQESVSCTCIKWSRAVHSPTHKPPHRCARRSSRNHRQTRKSSTMKQPLPLVSFVQIPPVPDPSRPPHSKPFLPSLETKALEASRPHRSRLRRLEV